MCTYIVHRNIAHIPGSKPKKKNKKINDFSLNRWELQCRITHNQSETNEQQTNEQQQNIGGQQHRRKYAALY